MTTTMLRADWVSTRLEALDELGDQPGHDVAAAHDLGELYAPSLGPVTVPPGGTLAQARARRIVEGNGIAWTTSAVNAWVLRVNGERNANGVPVFTSRSVILLPRGGPRPAVTQGPAPTAAAGGIGLGAVAFVGALLWSFFSDEG